PSSWSPGTGRGRSATRYWPAAPPSLGRVRDSSVGLGHAMAAWFYTSWFGSGTIRGPSLKSRVRQGGRHEIRSSRYTQLRLGKEAWGARRQGSRKTGTIGNPARVRSLHTGAIRLRRCGRCAQCRSRADLFGLVRGRGAGPASKPAGLRFTRFRSCRVKGEGPSRRRRKASGAPTRINPPPPTHV